MINQKNQRCFRRATNHQSRLQKTYNLEIVEDLDIYNLENYDLKKKEIEEWSDKNIQQEEMRTKRDHRKG